jgi:two-component system alkaline phosphatase synthesis response regulator PhoP
MAKKILVVDDEPDILKIVTFRLKKAGYEVTSAMDGQAALEAIRQNKPDLVFLDVRLPVIDGPELCLRIKNDESLRAIQVIFLTASSDSMDKVRAKELNAEGVLFKPFESEELLAMVHSLIG